MLVPIASLVASIFIYCSAGVWSNLKWRGVSLITSWKGCELNHKGFVLYAALDVPSTRIPQVLSKIVGVNLKTRSILIEVSLGNRTLGFTLTNSDPSANAGDTFGRSRILVDKVVNGSEAEHLGILPGDELVATSATFGNSLWSHSTLEGVNSALSTRFVMHNDVNVRFSRPISSIEPAVLPILQVPIEYSVRLLMPLGICWVDGVDHRQQSAVFIDSLDPAGSAARNRRIKSGDQLLALSAAWGGRMWAVSSAESVMDCLALRRRGEHVVLRFRCMVSISNLLGPTEKTDRRAEDLDGASLLPALQYNPAILKTSKERAVAAAEVEGLDSVAALREYVLRTTTAPAEDTALTALLAHKLMLRALELSCAQEAVRVFENLFGFRSNRTTVGSPVLAANVIVCATAVKAYGRLGDCDRALQVWRWLEGPLCQAADIHLLSAVLHVCAKMRRADIAERIFHQEIPARGLNYTTATANSMLYLYATLRRPQEALNMYQFMINQSLPCNDATYGTLIKALVQSTDSSALQQALDLLRSLPGQGVTVNTAMYNQLLSHYGRCHNYRAVKQVVREMGAARPPVPLDSASYTSIIHCYANSKKPHSALRAYQHMRRDGLPPTGSIYLAVLKALMLTRDAFSAVQVVQEMLRESYCEPDPRHYASAMFACVAATANTAVMAENSRLAETLIAQFLRHGGQLDVALCTLWLRALAQQGKWGEAQELLQKMHRCEDSLPRPSVDSYSTLLTVQVQAQLWQDALDTLQSALLTTRKAKGRVGQGLQGLYRALELALPGCSPFAAQRRREDRVASEGRGRKKRRALQNDEATLQPSEQGLTFLRKALQIIREAQPERLLPVELTEGLKMATQLLEERVTHL